MSDLSGSLSGGQAISGSLSGGSVLQGGLSMGGVSPAELLTKADVITDTASGSIVSIPDGMASPVLGLSVDIEPIQNLHGYSNPWPAGGGKNKMPNAIPKTVTDNGITVTLDEFGVFTITGTASTSASASCSFPLETPFVLLSGNPKPKFALGNSVGNANVSFRFFNQSIQVDSWTCNPVNRTAEYVGMQGKTVDEYRIIVNSGTTVNMTISPMIVENSITDYTFMPYSNICPISGRSEVKVTRTGKNLIGIENADSVSTTTASAVYTQLVNNVKWKENTRYTFSITTKALVEVSASRVWYARFHYTDGSATGYGASRINNNGEAIGQTETRYIVTSESGKTVAYIEFTQGTTYDVMVKDAMLEEGSTASSYAPYQGQTITIQLGQTVYGGTVDVTRGKLVITDAIVNLGTLNWNYISPTSNIPYGAFYANVRGKAKKENDVVCSSYPLSTNYFRVDKSVLGNSAANTVYLVDSSYTDTATFTSAMNGVQLVYELATTVEVTLTPQELDILFGDNNIWADSGDATVEYRADTKLWILKKIAQALNA